MGGYLVYLNDKLIGDICNHELYLKRTPTSDRLLADSELRYPYEGSKTLMGTSKNYVFRGGGVGRSPTHSPFAFRRKAKGEVLRDALMYVFDRFEDTALVQELLDGMYTELPEKKPAKA